MTVREYIGARYVPLFMGEWSAENAYEPLSIVMHGGNSYTSRQAVPVGIAITNETYWAVTGNYNAQIEAYRAEVRAYDERIEANSDAIADFNSELGEFEESTNTNIDSINEKINILNAKGINAYQIPYANIIARTRVPISEGEEIGEGCTSIEINGIVYIVLSINKKLVFFTNKTVVQQIDISNFVDDVNALSSYENKLYITTLTNSNLEIEFTTLNAYTFNSVEFNNTMNYNVCGFGYYNENSFYYVFTNTPNTVIYFAICNKTTNVVEIIKTINIKTFLNNPLIQGAGYYAKDNKWYFCFSDPNMFVVWDGKSEKIEHYYLKKVYSYASCDELEDVYFNDGKIGFSVKGIYSRYTTIQNDFIPTVFEYSPNDIEIHKTLSNRENINVQIHISDNYSIYNENINYDTIYIGAAIDVLAIASEMNNRLLSIYVDDDLEQCLIAPENVSSNFDLKNHYALGLFAEGANFSLINITGAANNVNKWVLNYNNTPTFIHCWNCNSIITGNWNIDSNSYKIARLVRCQNVRNSSMTDDYWILVTSSNVSY